MRVGRPSTSFPAPPEPPPTPLALKCLALSAAAVPLAACTPEGAHVLGLMVPGAAAVGVGGAVGVQMIGRFFPLEGMGELGTTLGALAGAVAGSALCAATRVLSRGGSPFQAVVEATNLGTTVALTMVVATGLITGNRSVRRNAHLPSLLGVLWAGALLSGFNCLASGPQ